MWCFVPVSNINSSLMLFTNSLPWSLMSTFAQPNLLSIISIDYLCFHLHIVSKMKFATEVAVLSFEAIASGHLVK